MYVRTWTSKIDIFSSNDTLYGRAANSLVTQHHLQLDRKSTNNGDHLHFGFASRRVTKMLKCLS